MQSKNHVYKTKVLKITGTSYKETYKKYQLVFKHIKRKSKRRPYIKSKYFNNKKIFFDYFWEHIKQKHFMERKRRLQFFSCGINLIQNSTHHPISRENINKKSEILHRFYGITLTNEIFAVQIKENKQSGRKQFMSVFPTK